jgi:hypothetical protein
MYVKVGEIQIWELKEEFHTIWEFKRFYKQQCCWSNGPYTKKEVTNDSNDNGSHNRRDGIGRAQIYESWRKGPHVWAEEKLGHESWRKGPHVWAEGSEIWIARKVLRPLLKERFRSLN